MANDDPPALDQEAAKLQVMQWRTDLKTRFFPRRQGAINPDDMPFCNHLFTAIEQYDMTNEYLVYSKIGRVVRKITLLQDGTIPREEEFQFRERARVLFARWWDLLNAEATLNAE